MIESLRKKRGANDHPSLDAPPSVPWAYPLGGHSNLRDSEGLGGQPGQLSSAQLLHAASSIVNNANHAINKLIETDFKMPASQFVALLPLTLGLAPRTSQRRAAFCNCGPAARAPDVGLVCLPRRELDGWILWVSQISKIFQNQHLRPSFLGLETKEAHSLTEHLPLSFGSPGWQKSRFPWSKAVKELRWHEIRFPHSWNSKNPMQLLHLGRWFLLTVEEDLL